jgi:glycosyltransferase involved in cell wall biosynthesis
MLDFCEDIYINDGGSTDGTLDILYQLQNEYGKDRVKLFERTWQHNRKMWADEKNFILDKVPMSNYNICIDADEVIHALKSLL